MNNKYPDGLNRAQRRRLGQKTINWLTEPVTGMPYVRDENPPYKLEPIGNYRRIPDFTPPATWRELVIGPEDHPIDWDPWFHKMFGREYRENKDKAADSPVDIRTQVMVLGKSWARHYGLHALALGVPGVIFWGNWTRIPPSWIVVDREQTYKLLSEAEAGIEH